MTIQGPISILHHMQIRTEGSWDEEDLGSFFILFLVVLFSFPAFGQTGAYDRNPSDQSKDRE